MKVSIHNRYTRFIVIEPQFRLRLITIVILAGLMAFLIAVTHKQRKTILRSKTKGQLVMRIPEMEKVITAQETSIVRAERQKRAEEKRIARDKHREALRQQEKQAAQTDLGQWLNEIRPLPAVEGVNISKTYVSALIDGEIYQEGDVIGSYMINKITFNAVILQHISTKKMEELFLDKTDTSSIYVDGEIYGSGDKIGGYVIVEITEEKIELEDEKTKEKTSIDIAQ